MKIKGYEKEFEDKNGIYVLKETELNISFNHFIANNLLSENILGLDHFFYKQYYLKNSNELKFEYFSISALENNRKYGLIPIKTNRGVKCIKGKIFYNEINKLILFIKKYIDFSMETDFTEYFKRNFYYNSSNRIDYDKLKEKLERISYFYELNYYFSNYITKDLLLDTFYIAKLKSKEYFLYKNSNKNPIIFVIFKHKEIEKYKIPYIEYIYIHNDYNDETIVTYRDNEIKIYENINDINTLFINEIDRNGIVFNNSFIDLLPDNMTELKYILKVPTYKEYFKLKRNSKNNIEKYDNNILESYFYVLPSLSPVYWRNDVKVIDDIDIFTKIISKINKKIYIPESIEYKFNPKILPNKNEYLYLKSIN